MMTPRQPNRLDNARRKDKNMALLQVRFLSFISDIILGSFTLFKQKLYGRYVQSFQYRGYIHAD